MSFVTCAPDPRLSATVLCYWRLDGLEAGRFYAAAAKRHVELVVNLGAPHRAGPAEAPAAAEYGSCWITGLRDRPLYLEPTGACVIYGARFQDFAVPDWLGAEVAGNHYWSTDLGRAPAVGSLVRALADCDELGDAAGVLDAYFLGRTPAPAETESLRSAIGLCEAQGQLTPDAIRALLGGSPRRARALAKRNAGISLRRFARLARFDLALVHLDSGRDERLADVAHDAGYYDEAHMAHDFAAFCGLAPAAYRRARRDAGRDALPHHLIASGGGVRVP